MIAAPIQTVTKGGVRTRDAMDLGAFLKALTLAEQDLVAETHGIKVHQDASIELPGRTRLYSMTPHARTQMASHLGIPTTWAGEMADKHGDLFAANFNYLLRKQASTPQMLRLFDHTDLTEPTLRAFLSPRYRRMDNGDLFDQALAPLLDKRHDLQVTTADVTNTRMFVRIVTPQLHREIKKGDIVQGGIEISNSEVGLGKLRVSPFVWRLVCLNGAKINEMSKFGRVHLGRDVSDGTLIQALYKADTLKLEDELLWRQVRDVAEAALQPETFDAVTSRMIEGTARVIPNEVPVSDVAAALADITSLSESEYGRFKDNLFRGSDQSQWGVGNAITALAYDTNDYNRAADLEGVGGDVLTWDAAQWNALIAAGARRKGKDRRATRSRR